MHTFPSHGQKQANKSPARAAEYPSPLLHRPAVMTLPALHLVEFPLDQRDRPVPTETAADVRYLIRAEIDADILCRLLNQFALQGHVPAEVESSRREDWMDIALRVNTLPRYRAEVIAQRMRGMVSVCSVDLHVQGAETVLSAT